MALSPGNTVILYISILAILLLLLPYIYHRKTLPPTQEQQLAQTEDHGLIMSSRSYADNVTRPPQAHVGGRSSVTLPPVPAVVIDEIEQLPLYEAPPPKYERTVKADEQRPVEMRDLERGESSEATASGSGPPPGYQAAADADGGGVSIRRTDTGGSHAEELPPPSPGALFVRRVIAFRPFSR